MAAPRISVETQIKQLGEARNLVLKDPGYWPQVLHGTLPIITGPVIEVRRWGADFLAETFSTPVVDARAKQELALTCLDTLLRLSNESETGVLKSVVQCSASVYPIIFRHICSNRNDADTWKKMTAIKSKILSLWDIAPIGVRICCMKFVQRVILVQSRGITDPRLMDRSEISLASVPANHPLLSLPSLDAEAQGLLDRLLSILPEEYSEPTLVTATLNNLAPLVKTRPPLAQKVVAAILAFNPFSGMPRTITTSSRLMMISTEKTVRVLLMNIMRNNPQGPFAGRISQHIARLSLAKTELNESFSRKRAAASQEAEAAKRQKMERAGAVQNVATPAATPPPPATPAMNPIQPMLPGPITYAKLFTLATDPAMTSFDGQQLPLDLVLQIVIGSMYSVDQNNLNVAISAVQARYNAITANLPTMPQPVPLLIAPAAPEPQTAPATTATAAASTTAPTLYPASPPTLMQINPPERIVAAKQERKEEEMDGDEIQLQLGEFRLPPPQPLSAEQSQRASLEAMDRVFSVIDSFETKSLISRKSKLGVNRLAASNWDREGWIALITRMVTRGSQDNNTVKTENGQPTGLADAARERLYKYVIGDFRRRMDVAVAWLNEEWYNDRVMDSSEVGVSRQPQYRKWMMKIMDGIFPFLEVKDRLFMRMLSEIPEIPGELLNKVKMLCLDPDRASLGISMLHYLAMLRPPVRGMCVDILEDLWLNHSEVRNQVQKLIQKWRPSVLAKHEAEEQADTKMMGANGDGTIAAAPNT